VGLYHPTLPRRTSPTATPALPSRGPGAPACGVLLFRSYILAGNTAHYDAVIAALETRGLAPVPAFTAGLDARPAIDAYFRDAAGRATVDAVVSLTGFSLVGGPAYNDTAAAAAVLGALDVPYLALQTLEFQSKEEWQRDPRGLNALQATLQVALPELDGATGPLVYGGRDGGVADGASAPFTDRVELLAARVARLVRLRRTARAARRVAVVLFQLPADAGNTGSAAYLAVLRVALQHASRRCAPRARGRPPRERGRAAGRRHEGNRERFGAPANVHVRVPATSTCGANRSSTRSSARGAGARQAAHRRRVALRHGRAVRETYSWALAAPLRLGGGSDAAALRARLRATHPFCAFYRWIREDFDADVALHFGTHGALEFLPGKQVGLTSACWPERLLGDLPSVYLYASNNPSEGTLAKRRAASTLVSYLTPPLANAGLYRGLAELKATIARLGDSAPSAERAELLDAAEEQARELELAGVARAELGDAPWLARLTEQLAEVERELIPVGLHTVGAVPGAGERAEMLRAIGGCPRPELGVPALADALVRRDGGAGTAAAREADAARCVARLVDAGGPDGALAFAEELGYRRDAAAALFAHLADVDARLRVDQEIPGLLRALDGRFVPPVPGGDVLRNPEVLPTGRNTYGFDPYRLPSAAGVREGRKQADALLARVVADGHALPPTVGLVLWGTDNMKSEGAPIALALALMGAVPRFDSMGRLAGAAQLPLATRAARASTSVVSLSGRVPRPLPPANAASWPEAALLAAQAGGGPDALNFPVRAARPGERAGAGL
jgi:magnesium chelatase subunit H